MKTFKEYMNETRDIPDGIEIKKVQWSDRKSNATGSPLVTKTTYHVVRKRDGKVLDNHPKKPEAIRRAKLLPKRFL